MTNEPDASEAGSNNTREQQANESITPHDSPGERRRARHAARPPRPRRRQGGQRLQLGRLHRRDDDRGFPDRHRHRGRLRHLQLGRDGGSQDHGRVERLRRGRYLIDQPAALHPERGLREARQGEAAQLETPRSGHPQGRRGPRSGQRILRPVHVGNDRDRGQSRHGEGAHPRRAARLDGTAAQSRVHGQSSPTAASTSSNPRPTSFPWC